MIRQPIVERYDPREFEIAQATARVLLRKKRRMLGPDDRVTYKQLVELIKEQSGLHVEMRSFAGPLEILQELCHENELPPLAVLVVHGPTKSVLTEGTATDLSIDFFGKYFALYGKPERINAHELEEKLFAEVKGWEDWSKLKYLLEI